MESSDSEAASSNDNNNAIANAPSVVITAACSPSDLAAVGAGDGEVSILKDDACADMKVANARVQQLIIENFDSSVSDGDISTNSISDSDAIETTHFEEPSEELAQKIITQVEFYFSDANILKDTFLLKHVRRNKEGLVSLKLVTSFKKMKALTRDYRVVAQCLQQSHKLAVNDEGTKVRRVNPLPDYDETTPSRTVVVVNIPSDNPTVDSIAEMFAKCGDIALIRILRPGKPIPQDVRKHVDRHPEIGCTICAIIEFENHQFAKEACEKLSDCSNWRVGMRVVLLAEKKHHEKKKTTDDKNKKNLTRKKKSNQFSRIEKNDNLCSSGSETDLSQLGVNASSRSDTAIRSSNGKNNSSGGENSSPRNQRRRNTYGKSKLAVSNEKSPRESPEMRRRQNVDQHSGGDSSSSSPWVQRRFKANQEFRNSSENTSPRASPMMARRFNNDGTSSPRMLDMSGVLRQPRGPDGTVGFTAGRGRGVHPAVPLV